MPGICSQDQYGSREGMVRILKMANEALVRQEWHVMCGQLSL